MVKLLIIADDFTGALDTGIQFQKRGIRTQIFTKTNVTEKEIQPDTEVLVVDSETRPLSGKQAYETVQNITKHALTIGVDLIFKKTDSALRGNIGAELSAMADTVGDGTIFFLPGYPDMKRITKNGTHYIEGELLEHSVFSQDPFEPVKISYIPDIIREQSDISVICVSATEEIPDVPKEKSRVILCDTVTTEDIDNRLDELLKKKCLQLMAGCAGLADRLAEKLKFSHKKAASFQCTDGIYIACGSLNKITEKQLNYAEEKGNFLRIHLNMTQKLLPAYYETEQGQHFMKEMIRLCRDNRRVIVDTFDQEEKKDTFLKEHQIEEKEIRFLISQCHGRIVNEIVKQHLSITILMTGGDTLMGYMKQIGCTQIVPVCEIEKGIVVSNLIDEANTVQVISKSGGFGDEDILCQIAAKVVKKN